MDSKRRTYLVPTHIITRERARRVEVTGKTSAQIDKITAGMLRNMSAEWFVDEVVE